MDTADVPRALAERLGADATDGLLSLLAATHQQWATDVTIGAVERFEQRLTAEIGGVRQSITELDRNLRQEITRVDSGLRQEITRVESGLRQEITRVESGLRQELTQVDYGLRQTITQSEATLRREIVEGDAKLLEALGDVRVDVLKWSIALWMGQVVALTGIMALMLRFMRP